MSSPARRQYLEIKAQYPDALLAYQVGDFYEFFDDDARIAAVELQIVLTARAYGPGERVPLAGVPLHALDTYLARLVTRGYKVAICEQISPAGKGLVRRAVTRMLTPGTITEPGMLPPRRDTYLVAVAVGRRDPASGIPTSAGLAYVDASTGAFACAQWSAEQLPDGLRAELQRLAPAEALVAENGLACVGDGRSQNAPTNGRQLRAAPADDDARTDSHLEDWLGDIPLSPCPPSYFDSEGARLRLCRHFATPTLAAFGCEQAPQAVMAAGAILAYLERMNPALLRLLTSLQTYETSGFVGVDGRTWRALEVIEPAHTASSRSTRPATLLSTLDATRTASGARLLRRTLLHPLRDRATLEERLDAVDELHVSAALRQRLAGALAGLADLERLSARIVAGTATPRELHALAGTLSRIPELSAALRECRSRELRRLRGMLDSCDDVRDRIERAVTPPHAGTGRLLRSGHSDELDALAQSVADSRRWIAELEPTERERSGIKSLRVGYNKVFGYYIEVSRPNLARVPADYQRRQTLSTGERFVTADLKEHEARVLHAEEQIEALEKTLYAALLEALAAHQLRLRSTAAALAQVDVYLALAEVAVARGYVRPELRDDTVMEIEAGRHPVVEATLEGVEFVPNDTSLAADRSADAARIALLTGPNMAGKSTYLRQVATITLLAQIGSFVPARRAVLGLVDRIFTRVGAEDDLARGLSTFMMEMVETAYILRHATERSLVILDEVGRGTSTTDGVALARAVVEHLHDTIGARTLFATHYHELSSLGETLPRLRVYRMEVAERDGEAIFLHRVAAGASDSSYGVQVARMAGLPAGVTERAAQLVSASPASGTAVESAAEGDATRPAYAGQESACADRDASLPHDVSLPRVVGARHAPPDVSDGEQQSPPTVGVRRVSPALATEDTVSQLDDAADAIAQAPSAHRAERVAEPSAGYGAHVVNGNHVSFPPSMAGTTLANRELEAAREVALALASVNVAATTPMDAINLLFSLQQRALAALSLVRSREGG